MRRVRSGARNHLLTYQTPVYGLTPLRQREIVSHTNVSTHWCEVRTPNGRDVIDATQRKATLTHVLTTDHPGTEFDPEGRLTDGTNHYDITGALDPDGRKVDLVIYATRALNAGGA